MDKSINQYGNNLFSEYSFYYDSKIYYLLFAGYFIMKAFDKKFDFQSNDNERAAA